MSEKPLVSVIIPVHNAANYLYNMLDSLIYQTLENIEIILVENSSTDNTMEIIKDFKCRFPEKIKYTTIPPTTGPTPGRIEGLKMARADYIYFCDADDLVEFHALENMYRTAIEKNCDLVYGPSYNILPNGEAKLVGRLPKHFTMEEFILGQVPSFWSKLIYKPLLEQVGPPEEGFSFDDVAYILPLCTYAKKIGYVDRAVYYYFRREDSQINSPYGVNALDTIEAERYALTRCNPKYRNLILLHIANRMRNNITLRWYGLDRIVDWIKEMWPWISINPYIQKRKNIYQLLEQYSNLPKTSIPKTIVVAQFGGGNFSDFIKVLQEKAFNFRDGEIICLSESNCNIEKAPEIVKYAYERGSYELVGHYFALQYIYENGGIYVDSRLKFTASLNLVLPFEAFFGFADKENFTDKIFGAQKGDKIIKSLLETYSLENYCDMQFAPLARRIKNILVVEEDVALNGRTSLFQYSCALFSAEVFVVRAAIITGYRPALHVCEYPYTIGEEEDLVTIPRATLIDLVNRASERGGRTVQMLKKQVEAQKRKVNRLKNSRSWRITRPLRQAAHFVKRKRMK